MGEMLRHRSSPVVASFAAILLFLALGTSYAAAPAASAFYDYPTTDIFLSPSFTSGTLTYLFSLGAYPTLTYNGQPYAITGVWGLYAVNKTGSAVNDIVTAGGSSLGDWTFDTNPNAPTYQVAGWTNPNKTESVLPPNGSKLFVFSDFTFDGAAPVLGIHVTVDLAGQPSPFGQGNTGSIIPTEKYAIPEIPTALLGAAGMMAGACVRRLRRRG